MNREIRKAARKMVDHLVAQGFPDEAFIIDYAEFNALADVDPQPELTDQERTDFIKSIVAERLEKRRRAEQRWSRLTDCDRLDMAFADLQEQGILARQNFRCCSNCASFSVYFEIDDEKREKGFWKGYVFYHQQDTECAPGGTLYLGFGAMDEREREDQGEQARMAIGEAVVETLGRYRLKTSWNGDHATRIKVVDLDWRRRRFTTPPKIKVVDWEKLLRTRASA